MADIAEILEQSFVDYGAFVLQRRALPDMRDGIKYTARQIIHAQKREKHDYNHPFKKSQKSVAAATGFSYVHGDTSAYEQIIHMGRPLVQRYFIEDISGNGGQPTKSRSYAAMRYTECRLSQLSDTLFKYIDEKVIAESDWAPTYDDESIFPLVLPSVGYYNICNGSFGSIGVGLISSIPQFNLKEMNEAICNLIDNPNAEINILPDFASGGIILNPETTLKSLAKGEGRSVLLRGKIKKNIKEKYVDIIELPYGVYTDTVCVELDKGMNNGAPITKFTDLTKNSVHIRVWGNNPDTIEEWLYKNTSVQKHFTIKITMLKDGKVPKVVSLKTALKEHIVHSAKVYHNHFKYELSKLAVRQEVLEGLIRAYSILDEVIATIKASKGRADVISNLQTKFEFTQRQAEAIADLKLHRLSSLDIQKLRDELIENLKEQENIRSILADQKKFNELLKDRYKEVAVKFGDNRKTEIFNGDQFEAVEDGSKTDKAFYCLFSENGYHADTEDQSSMTYKYIEPEQEIIFLTSKLRGIIRKSSDFKMGSHNYSEIMSLKDDEKVLIAIEKDTVSNFNYIEMETVNGEKVSIHSSFLEIGATKRGKKITPKKIEIKSANLVDTTDYPKL